MTSQKESQELPDTCPSSSVGLTGSQKCTWSSHSANSFVWGRLYPAKPQFKSLQLVKEEYKIGRATSCDLIIGEEVASNILGAISKEHFKLSRNRVTPTSNDFIVYLHDNSFNGTFVNGKKIGKGNSIVLQNNNVISLAFNYFEVFVYIDTKMDSDIDNYPQQLKNRYAISRRLGCGAYGEVKLVFDKFTSKGYAMKIIQKKKFLAAQRRVINDPVKIEREISILKSLTHPCIVGFEEAFDSPDLVFIVLELMEGGELFNKINSSSLKESDCKLYFYQMVLAVQYLHQQGIIHRDIKPENILLATKQTDTLIKLSDFGLSKFVDSELILMTFCGTPMYIAPEVLKNHGKPGSYDKRIDIWSLGVVLYACLSGCAPFSSAHKYKTLSQQILEGDYKFPNKYWKKVSPSAVDLVRRMLIVNPDRRISIDDILKHPWLRDRALKMKYNRLLMNQNKTVKRLNNNENTSDNENNCDDVVGSSAKKRKLMTKNQQDDDTS